MQEAQKRNLMYAPILQNRYNPAVRALKAAVDAGRFGRISSISVRLRWCRFQDYYDDGWHGTWRMDGGVINQQALHHVDALRWVGGAIAEVVSLQTKAVNQLEAEDTTSALVRFESGAQGIIEATTAARPIDFEASISVVGERGLAQIGGIALNKIVDWKFIDQNDADMELVKRASQEVPTGYGLSHGPLLNDIFDRIIANNYSSPISATDAASTLELIHAVYRSDELKSWVRLSDNPRSSRLGQN
jgi:predicted dehydrogenase